MAQTHGMIDTETLGTRTGSIILSLGAIKFDPSGDNRLLCSDPKRVEDIHASSDSFYRRIELQSCKRIGMTADPDTIKWWMQQAPTERFEAFDAQPRIDIAHVLTDFWLWWGNTSCPWSHGASFDIPLVDEAYAKIGKRSPWKYTLVRDTRTLFDLAKFEWSDQKKFRAGPGHHHALFDAWNQVLMVQECFRRMQSNASNQNPIVHVPAVVPATG